MHVCATPHAAAVDILGVDPEETPLVEFAGGVLFQLTDRHASVVYRRSAIHAAERCLTAFEMTGWSRTEWFEYGYDDECCDIYEVVDLEKNDMGSDAVADA